MPKVDLEFLPFTVVMDKPTREIQDKLLWHMLFANNIFLLNETRESPRRKLNNWKRAHKSENFKISCTKKKHLICNFRH